MNASFQMHNRWNDFYIYICDSNLLVIKFCNSIFFSGLLREKNYTSLQYGCVMDIGGNTYCIPWYISFIFFSKYSAVRKIIVE